MISFTTLQKLALSFPETTEEPHFEKKSFRVKKKIFATYDDKTKRATLKMSLMDQHLFSVADSSIIYPVENAWGKQGWTIIEMRKVRKEQFKEALIAAYCEVAPEKHAIEIRAKKSE